MVAQDVGDGRDDRVGVARLQLRDEAQRGQVGTDVGEQPRVLHLSGHHRLRHPRVLQHG